MNKTPTSIHRVQFTDCDMFGHMNNSRYLDYMVNARQDHLKDEYNFDYHEWYKKGLGWVISSHEIVYLKPAFFQETVTIQSTLMGIDTQGLNVEVLMLNQARTHLKAILRSRLTFINLKTGKKEPHDQDFLNWAQQLVEEDNSSMQERIKGLVEGMR